MSKPIHAAPDTDRARPIDHQQSREVQAFRHLTHRPTPVQISRPLHAHEIVVKAARTMARLAAEVGDDGTNDLLVSDVVRTSEKQVWFLSEHVVDVPLVKADGHGE